MCLWAWIHEALARRFRVEERRQVGDSPALSTIVRQLRLLLLLSLLFALTRLLPLLPVLLLLLLLFWLLVLLLLILSLTTITLILIWDKKVGASAIELGEGNNAVVLEQSSNTRPQLGKTHISQPWKIEHVHYVKQTAEKWAKPKEDSNDRPGEGPTKTCTSSSFKLKNSYQRNFSRRSDVRDSQRSASPPRAPTAEGVLAVRLLALQQKQKQIKLLPKW